MKVHNFALAAIFVVSAASLRGDPGQLRSVDPLSLPEPSQLGPMAFAPDPNAPGEKIQSALWEEALKSDAEARIPVIVTLHEPLLSEELAGTTAPADAYRAQWVAAIAHRFAALATPLGLTELRALSHFPLVFARVGPNDLLEIASLPSVKRVDFDAPLEALRTQGGALMNSPTLRNNFDGDGAGVEVAVIDSGVFPHNEFASRIRAHGDFTGAGDDGTIDGSGHGTSVTGIIAGTGGGMAPAAGIWAMKVFLTSGGSAQSSWVLSALNTAYAERSSHGGLDVVNMSIGGGRFNSDCDASSPFTTVVNQIVAAGIPVFVASGNDGFINGISHPACLSKVIAVGAVTDAAFNPDPFCGGSYSADRITCYSNSGVPLDILAPSHCARSTKKGGGLEDCFSGTSAATPYAAGVAAQILSIRPQTTPAQLRNALMSTGRPITDVNSITRKRIDAVQAYQSLAGTGSGPCEPGPTTACLLSGRFKVEVEWTNFSAVTQDAFVASAGTSDTALFYWTNPNNWELLIKGINACSFNNKFWIYFAAATNVGYRVTVTDTQAGGATKVYTNAVGNLAQATNDISAFSCP